MQVGGEAVPPGRRRELELPVARLPTDTWLSIPVVVLNGRAPGPTVWLSGAVHGDEINGVEIVRRLARTLDPRRLAGTVIAVPVVNVFGFVNESRSFPDRRDLNRSFPGSTRGSLAARLAHLFMQEVVSRSDDGIDFHTATDHRTNLPQLRCDLDDPETRRCAVAFGAPMTLHSRLRDGSLREAATSRGIPVLLYEGGEPVRFNEWAIRAGVDGALRVLQELGMWDARARHGPSTLRERGHDRRALRCAP